MRTTTGVILALIVAALVGLGLTARSIERGRGASALVLGPWVAIPRSGTPEADPYTRAVNARLGSLPLAVADGIELTAETDSSGKTLDGRCIIRMSPSVPSARYWTLTLYDSDWQLVPNEAGRSAFTSQEIIREPNGQFAIVIAPTARPGNWLPTGGTGAYRLVLRLYDSTVAVTLSERDRGLMPTLTQEGCP